MASEMKAMDSTSNKQEKNKKKYTGRNELLNDVNGFYANIYKKRERQPGVSIEKFLGDLKDKPEVVSKRLTEEEKENKNKKITE